MINFYDLIGCGYEYETKSGRFVEGEMDEAKAKLFTESPDMIKEKTFKAYKEIGKLTDEQLRKLLPNGFRRLKKGILDKEKGTIISNNFEIEITKM